MIRHDASQRQRLAELKREIATIKAKTPEERRAEKNAKRDREKALVRTEGQRAPRERDPAFLAYLRRQPCEAGPVGCSGPIEAAHIRYADFRHGGRTAGMQTKGHDRHATPLCHFHHHHDQHKRKERAFWEGLGKDPYEVAARHYAKFRGFAPTRTLSPEEA